VQSTALIMMLSLFNYSTLTRTYLKNCNLLRSEYICWR